MRPPSFSRAALASAFLLLAAAAFPFSFEPMSVSFDPSGPGAVRTFRLKNEGTERVAVRIRLLTRESAEDGTETNRPADEASFTVFPSRFVLEAGAARSLKVQWKGGEPGDRELAFRIVAEQVPVEFGAKQGSGISLLFKYVGALYVRPQKAAAPAVAPVSAVGAEKDGARGVLLRLRNSGGLHVILVNVALTLASGGDPIRVDAAALSALEGINLLAGAERVFFVPLDSAAAGTAYDARIAFTPES